MRYLSVVHFVLMLGMGFSLNAADWEITTIQGSLSNFIGCSIAIDQEGYAHVTFVDSSNSDLKHAYQTPTGFQIETITTFVGSGGRSTSLVIDGNDHPRVSFYDDLPLGFLKYSYYNGTTWNTETVDSSADVGIVNSMVLDSSDIPHITYYDYDHEKSKYAYRSGGVWTTATLPDTGSVGASCDIALDQSDYPHICYYDDTNDTFAYIYKDGSGWHTERPYAATEVGWYNSIAFDQSGNLHCSFFNHAARDLVYAKRSAGVWNFTLLATAGDVGTFCSLDVDSNGYPHIAYRNTTESYLQMMHQDGSGWQTDTIDTNVSITDPISLTVDENDRVHITYYDAFTQILHYAREASVPTPTPTPTSPPEDIYYDLAMPDVFLEQGDLFHLERNCGNNLTNALVVDEYILLEVTGMFWFWPTWTPSVDSETWTLSAGQTDTEIVFDFEWPAVEGGMTGLRFWGGFVQSGTMNLLDYDMIEFGYGEETHDFELACSAFFNGDTIPVQYTCDGDDISPPLIWVFPPETTQAYALIMDDPDAPGGVWVHWVLYNIPGSSRGILEDLPDSAEFPDGSRHGTNSWSQLGYGGPCPPSGTHRYFFTLYALDSMLPLASGATKAEVVQAMQGHIVGEASYMGTYR